VATHLAVVAGEHRDDTTDPLFRYNLENFEVFGLEDSAAMLAAVPKAPPPVRGGGCRRPEDLSRDEAVAIVKGLREMMYRTCSDSPDSDIDLWDPDQSVSGADLVAWVAEEMGRHGLVPWVGPVDAIDG
jgi:hypothetical protein